jgi:type VI secretion system protein ImpJ
MHLAQHHFQAQSQYFEELSAFATASLRPHCYGVVGLELDHEALLNGVVSLVHGRGIMPDGLVFHFPEDAVPQPLSIRETFSPTQESHLVLLAIPRWRRGQANCVLDDAAGGEGTRFRVASEQRTDEITGENAQSILVARKAFRLLLDYQVGDEFVTLPLARVRRDGAGHFVYDAAYIPPCVQIGASTRIMEVLVQLVELLGAKAASLAAERADAASRADYATHEIAGFWLSHAVNSSLTPLRHHLATHSAHPEALYLELARLAGALCTFSLHADPLKLPLYDHDALEGCFEPLVRHIRSHLDLALPTRALRIQLELSEPFLHGGVITDSRCFRDAHWYLGVRSSVGQGEVIARVPKLVKVCSSKHVLRLVREAFPGLALEPVASPPPEISPRPEMVYFRIGQSGPCWTSLCETAQVGVYVPDAIPDAQVELTVVLGT